MSKVQGSMRVSFSWEDAGSRHVFSPVIASAMVADPIGHWFLVLHWSLVLEHWSFYPVLPLGAVPRDLYNRPINSSTPPCS
jgi:hypothetical protein